jgi:hypothetical protein
MFDALEQQKSTIARIVIRVVVCLFAGALLTFALSSAMDALWPYFQDEHYQPHPAAVLITKFLNLPAVLYCSLFTLPPGLPKSDESLYCWSVGFLFNIPYYGAIIFLLWSLVSMTLNRTNRMDH